MGNQQLFWYDGQLQTGNTLKLRIDDPGLIYGATVFTTLRLYNRSLEHPLTNWQGHCDRLHHSIETFDWPAPDWQKIRQGVESLIPHFPVVRIVLFPDGREWITGRQLPLDLQDRQQMGIYAWLADVPELSRSLAKYKTGNYLGAWIAGQKAQALGAKEAILVDEQKTWLETSTGNLWGWKNGSWWTPPLGEILPGTVRSQLIRWLESQGHSVEQQQWHCDRVNQFETLAYTNSVMEVIPIHQVLTSSEPLKYKVNHPALAQLKRFFAPCNL